MEEEEGGIRLSKRFTDKGGEVDYKSTSGTAWSHNFLNQKPWHPLSYPNQRRKWIAEQQHAQHQRRNEEVSREYAQEQEFFRQAALVSKKEKEKLEIMQAVSFMYVRPPGYNAESAKAAELAESDKKTVQNNPSEGPSSSMPQHQEGVPYKEEKKARPKDVFGRSLPTEEEFQVLKNAPKMDTGVHGRVKPFAVEVRNVKCVRCGNFGHQSGDRECPLKDAVMPSEENRLKRDDPLTAIIAHTDASEPVKWELKQKPGLSPPRGGFDPDDPNQQIVAEDIYDEYGGFLGGGGLADLIPGFPSLKQKKSKKKSKRKKQSLSSGSDVDIDDRRTRGKKIKRKRKEKAEPSLSPSEDSASEKRSKKGKKKYSSSRHSKAETDRWQPSPYDDGRKSSRGKEKKYSSSEDLNLDHDYKKHSRGKEKKYSSSEDRNLDHDYKKHSSSRHGTEQEDRSRLPRDDDDRRPRKQHNDSYSFDEETSDHDYRKQEISRNRISRREDFDKFGEPGYREHRHRR